MQLEEFNNHKIHQQFLELKDLRNTNEVLQKTEALELAFLTDATINIESILTNINAFLIIEHLILLNHMIVTLFLDLILEWFRLFFLMVLVNTLSQIFQKRNFHQKY